MKWSAILRPEWVFTLLFGFLLARSAVPIATAREATSCA